MYTSALPTMMCDTSGKWPSSRACPSFSHFTNKASPTGKGAGVWQGRRGSPNMDKAVGYLWDFTPGASLPIALAPETNASVPKFPLALGPWREGQMQGF